MKEKDVYELGPDAATTEMCDLAVEALGPEWSDKHLEFAERILKIAQEAYRLGAFNMEHKNGIRCEAEDQGGWPACNNPAEFFVKKEHLGGLKRAVYCSEHQDNRFFNPEHMAPIYKAPT